uniref:Signal peptidase complex subunit 1 n=1 Tax=Alexandrium andersonii TaxID=327968 RepID=A0A7S2ND54_9DINO|mmetsp:Transcript_91645/g.205206  ORF Transcript_91645/g.205206 Transcript_91645/m.205206 type:complete len:115 (+) Transcript_91645:104-448(+)
MPYLEMTTWQMLKSGSTDFIGQKQAYNLQFYAIWLSGIIGFIHGYIEQRFLLTFYWIFGATMLVTVLCLPAWPIWNRNPVDWLEPLPEEKNSKEAPEKKSGSKGATKKKGEKGH